MLVAAPDYESHMRHIEELRPIIEAAVRILHQPDIAIAICAWRVISYDALKHHVITRNVPIPEDRSNGDGTAMKAFNVDWFPADPPIQIMSHAVRAWTPKMQVQQDLFR